MDAPPKRPKIYHITHADNLPDILSDGYLLSDSSVASRDGPTVMIGMSDVKHRRLRKLLGSCHPDTVVGDYVPFHFGPRSIMLYVIHMGERVDYKGGQGSIIHLEADLCRVVERAKAENRKWAIASDSAAARYTEFKADLGVVKKLNWERINARNWKDDRTGKQAEFLIHERFEVELVERIGVANAEIRAQVERMLRDHRSQPKVEVRRDWYY